MDLKPSQIITEFNKKEKDARIEDIEINGRKISTWKNLLKSDTRKEKITNINELQEWFDEKCISNGRCLNHRDNFDRHISGAII